MDKFTKDDAQVLVDTAANKGEAIEEMIRKGCNFKEALGYWKVFGAKAASRGFKGLFFNKLKDGVMTEDEVKAFITEFGSENDLRQIAIHMAIARLTNDIHRDKESGDE